MAVIHFWNALNEIDAAAVLHVDLDGRILYANAGVHKVLGYPPETITGQSISSLLPAAVRADHQLMFERYAKARREGKVGPSPIVGVARRFQGGSRNALHAGLRFAARHASGRKVPLVLTVNEVRDDAGRLEGFLALMVDWTNESALRERLRRKDVFDEQTGLLCLKGLRAAVGQRTSTGRHALLHLDIDHFSTLVMASYQAADNALKAFATWLQLSVQREFDQDRVLVAKHVNAAEFLVYLEGAAADQAVALAASLRGRFARINLGPDHEPFYTTLSIGVAALDGPGNLEYGLSRAAHACYLARARGHDRIALADERDLKVYQLGQAIRDALRCGRLEVFAQKIVGLNVGRSIVTPPELRFEVLCRLSDPSGVHLPPAEVFPAAEQLGLAWPLDEAMVRATLAQLSAWPEAMERLDLCSINLSAMSVANAHALPTLSALIDASGIDPARLCFEVTESAAVLDSDVALNTLDGLRAMGCLTAIDDFGSGYSNFHSLSGWPVDIVKIDGEYVLALQHDRAMHVDTQGMIASARARGMQVIAEYAESASIVEELRQLGVDFAQGFEFHRPEPLAHLLGSLDDASVAGSITPSNGAR
jgi:diguanylate cyclase